MYTYCVIPEKTQHLLDLLPELDLTDADRALLATAVVTKVQVDTAAAAWEVCLTVPAPLPAELLTLAADHICRRCGLAVEVSGPGVERWAARIAEENGFVDVTHSIELFGLCASCAAASA